MGVLYEGCQRIVSLMNVALIEKELHKFPSYESPIQEILFEDLLDVVARVNVSQVIQESFTPEYRVHCLAHQL
jgi:hypothetical protein